MVVSVGGNLTGPWVTLFFCLAVSEWKLVWLEFAVRRGKEGGKNPSERKDTQSRYGHISAQAALPLDVGDVRRKTLRQNRLCQHGDDRSG